jgi:hypothetical protein
MGACEVCGNDYDMSFEVHAQGAVHVFDSFECAITRMAPLCDNCGCRIIGHGVEVDRLVGHGVETDRRWYCCAHCARQSGTTEIVDRVAVMPGR